MHHHATFIATWLSINSALPATYAHPEVKYLDRVQIRKLCLAALTDKEARQAAALGALDKLAFHPLSDNANNIIYLSEGWSAASPADVSILVHEMVQHLQNKGGTHPGVRPFSTMLQYWCSLPSFLRVVTHRNMVTHYPHTATVANKQSLHYRRIQGVVHRPTVDFRGKILSLPAKFWLNPRSLVSHGSVD